MKIFYGWRMVAAGGSIQFLQAGLLQQAFGAYVALLADERGWSKTALSGAAALQSVEAALLGPLLGLFVDRLGAQGMIRAGILIFGIGFLLFSQIDSLTGFYIASLVLAVGTSLSGFFPLTVGIIQWFEEAGPCAVGDEPGHGAGRLLRAGRGLVDDQFRLANHRVRLGHHCDPGRVPAGTGVPQPA